MKQTVSFPQTSAVPKDTLWDQLVERLHDDELRGRLMDRMGRTGSYRGVVVDACDVSGGWPAAPFGAGLRERRFPADDEDVSYWRAHGAFRAEQGVSSSDMMHAWRIYHAELRRRARELMPRDHPDTPAVLLEFLELSAAWVDIAMIATNAGHRAVEMEAHRRTSDYIHTFARNLLQGSASPSELRDGAETLGIDLAASVYAVRAKVSPGTSVSNLERFLHTEAVTTRRRGITALIDGDLCGIVWDLPSTPAPTAFGVSDASSIDGAPAAFSQASRALATVLAQGASPGLHTFASLGLAPAVLADPAMGERLRTRYIAPFEGLGQSGQAILDTVWRFIVNDGQLKVTAEELFLHTNSVRYRITRFEQATGCSLRSYGDLVEVWWAFNYFKMRRTIPKLTRIEKAEPPSG